MEAECEDSLCAGGIAWNFNVDGELQFVYQSKTFLFAKTQPISALLGFIVIRDGAELAHTTLVEVAFKPNRTLLIHDPEYIPSAEPLPTALLLNNTRDLGASLRVAESEPVDVSQDELVARAVHSLMRRDEEPTEAAIQLEMQQIRNDQLVAYELYVSESKKRGERTKSQSKLRANPKENEAASDNNSVTLGIENFFTELNEGIKTSYQSFTEFVESKLGDSKQGALNPPVERPSERERQPLLSHPELAGEEQPALSDSSEDFVDLDETSNGVESKIRAEPISLMFRQDQTGRAT